MEANTAILQTVSIIIAAAAFLSGVAAWKREFIGKRNIELAETVLAMFYEASDIIKQIRSPFSFSGEGKSRKRSEHEYPQQSEFLDRGYIVHERYMKHEKVFADLRSLRYRTMATFGSETAKPFHEINAIINSIFVSAQMLSNHYWPAQNHASTMDQAEFDKHLADMYKHEAVFWSMSEDDPITTRVNSAVAEIEAMAKRAIESHTWHLLPFSTQAKRLALMLFSRWHSPRAK